MRTREAVLEELQRLNNLLADDERKLEGLLLNRPGFSALTQREYVDNLLANMKAAMQCRQALLWVLDDGGDIASLHSPNI